ncbi:hypothetical protein [Nostoc sp.]|uniref:hypothetical protein n=1 Tax=Nostoc sp. TaxID=1180 RepID=UPI002FF561E6
MANFDEKEILELWDNRARDWDIQPTFRTSKVALSTTELFSLKIGIKNQLGKLTSRPTLRWIFQCFQGIHVLTLNGVNEHGRLTAK